MNLLQGEISGGKFRVGEASLPLPRGSEALEGRKVTYGIRPEHLRLDPEAGVGVQVTVLEPTGAETQVLGRLGGKPVVGAFRERITTKPGEMLMVSPDTALVHLFDTETGQRLN